MRIYLFDKKNVVKLKIFSLLFFLLLSAAIFTSTAQAQSQCSVRWVTNVFFWTDAKPPGASCGPGPGSFMFSCTYPQISCPPPASWCPTCQTGGAAAGKPINLSNGNVYIQDTDVSVPGLGGGLNFARIWNSMFPAGQSGQNIGMFGPNWRSTYEERVYTDSSSGVTLMVYLREDGAIWYFSGSGSNWNVVSPANAIATLVNTNNQYWTLTFQNGEKRTFSYSSGSLTSIIDRNSNTIQLTYDGSNRLMTVTDAALRHLYFTYASGSSRLVTALTSDIGIGLGYQYDSQGRLTQVTKPDSTTVSFTYNDQSLITAVSDTDGKILESHTYDARGRGLSSSQANGVNSVTVSYPY